jgi:hypothetical protein
MVQDALPLLASTNAVQLWEKSRERFPVVDA